MTLLNSMLTSISGMNGQAEKVQTVASNIANSSTSGYKRVETLFHDLSKGTAKEINAGGGIIVFVRQAVGHQGELFSSENATDFAVDGEGMFVIQDGEGRRVLSRNGAFTLSSSGELVSANGLKLMGHKLSYENSESEGSISNVLEVIKLTPNSMSAGPTDNAKVSFNLPSYLGIVPADELPSVNSGSSQAQASTSLTAYDNLGKAVVMNFHFSKVSEHNWELSVYDNAQKAGNPFPYSGDPIHTETLSFNPSNGAIESPIAISLDVPGGRKVHMSVQGSTQLAAPFTLMSVNANGSPAGVKGTVEIDEDGYLRYSNGGERAEYRIPLATVNSVNYLQRLNGSQFAVSTESGPMTIGYSNEGPFGRIKPGYLEASTIDLGRELTDMLEAQRNYAANSKVFKSSGDMLEILLSLKN